jgi:carbamoyltransferase
MGDEGLGLGAALYAGAEHGTSRPFRFSNLYFGPDYTDREIEDALDRGGLRFTRLSDAELAARVASGLAAGKVVALFRGRMEFGPRALGHRSVLYQTTDATVNDWLNKRFQRTEFMPFAPVTLDEHAERCYESVGSRRYTARFMTVTCDCTPWMKQVSPAVVHLDGTARPQLITRDAEPFYYDILKRYHEQTGIPSLINTSFNMHEEPIVCTPEDAVRAFRLGHLDYLVLGSFLACANGSLPGAA